MKKRKRSSHSRNWGRTFRSLWEYLTDNKKRIMPIVLLVCVAITILIAIRANRIAADQAIADADEQESSSAVSFEVTDAKLMQDINPEINALISQYFDAYVSGDVSILNTGLYRTLDEIETVTIEERARYIEDVDNLTVYTKTGPVENSWVAYAYTDVRYIGCDDYVPAMLSLYICKDEDGVYYINADENSQSVKDYITAVSLQDDVVDLYNRVNVEYAEKLENNKLLSELVAAIYAEIDESVGERLIGVETAVADAGDTGEGTAAAPSGDTAGTAVAAASTEASTEPEVPKEVRIKAKTTVNVRKSDSTEADILGKAREGEEYVRIAEQGNGWSKISFAGSAAYVKTEFFEIVSDEGDAAGTETASAEASTASSAGTGASSGNASTASSAGTGASSGKASTASSAGTAASSGKASTASSAGTGASSGKASTASSAGTGASSGKASTASSAGTGASSGKASTASSAGTGASSGSAASTGKTSDSNKTATISGTGTKTVTTSLRLRKEPSTDADIITTLYGGAKVKVTKIRDDGWCEVEANGKKGYMKSEYLQD